MQNSNLFSLTSQTSNFKSSTSKNKSLEYSVKALFTVGLLGQFAFAIYIFIFYGGSAIKGEWDTWTEALIHGFLEGDLIGNFVLVMHILLAFIITIGGPLQFVKRLRTKGNRFHKWNGRIYIFTAFIISIGALYMVWSKEVVVGGQMGRIANTLNAILIIYFSFMTFNTAIKAQFVAHRKWAIRTFIVASGVWFFRIGFGTWFLLTGFTTPGVSQDLTGWFDQFLYFGSYLVPLTITELYLHIKQSDSMKAKKYFSFFLFALVPILIGGTIVTAKVFWFG